MIERGAQACGASRTETAARVAMSVSSISRIASSV